jgi:hypothetical protein
VKSEDQAADIAAKRIRLAEVEAALIRLRERYDLLMNRFKFDEAKVAQGEIEAAERERRALAAALPPSSPEPAPAPFTVARTRRRRR